MATAVTQSWQLFPKKVAILLPNITEYIFNSHNCWKKKICKWNTTEHLKKKVTQRKSVNHYGQ